MTDILAKQDREIDSLRQEIGTMRNELTTMRIEQAQLDQKVTDKLDAKQ